MFQKHKLMLRRARNLLWRRKYFLSSHLFRQLYLARIKTLQCTTVHRLYVCSALVNKAPRHCCLPACLLPCLQHMRHVPAHTVCSCVCVCVCVCVCGKTSFWASLPGQIDGNLSATLKRGGGGNLHTQRHTHTPTHTRTPRHPPNVNLCAVLRPNSFHHLYLAVYWITRGDNVCVCVCV